MNYTSLEISKKFAELGIMQGAEAGAWWLDYKKHRDAVLLIALGEKVYDSKGKVSEIDPGILDNMFKAFTAQQCFDNLPEWAKITIKQINRQNTTRIAIAQTYGVSSKRVGKLQRAHKGIIDKHFPDWNTIFAKMHIYLLRRG